MFIHLLCLCPLRVAIMLNFNTSKAADCYGTRYWQTVKYQNHSIYSVSCLTNKSLLFASCSVIAKFKVRILALS